MGSVFRYSVTACWFFLAVPAFAQAQTEPSDTGNPAATKPGRSETPPDIVVTGSILRRTDRETPSPLSVINAADLQRRGISTVADALQTLPSNGSGTLTNSYSAIASFTPGASAPSLRGLTTDSTLVLFDGLRGAFYPIADDAVRNFVDTNTIPDAIVDRIEVLRDGASSTYGADAVAGVINIILKKQITGFSANVETGISQQGDAAHQRLSATYGWGDLKRDGFNVYLSAEYQHDAELPASSRGFPYNTQDYSGLVGHDAAGNIVHGQNLNANALGPDGFFLLPVPVAEVAPADAAGHQIPGTFYEPIAGNCGSYVMHRAVALESGIDTVCEANLAGQFDAIEPRIDRFGITGHLTADVGGRAQAYAVFTYYQVRTSNPIGFPFSVTGRTTDGYNGTALVLPAVLTAGPNAGKLNPNDPFAAAGEGALIRYSLADVPQAYTEMNRTYRGAAGIKGSFGEDWEYAVDVTGMKSQLSETGTGAVYIAGLLSVVADGSYNFVDPSKNSQAVRDRISPPLHSRASSSLYQGQASLTKKVLALPGGDAKFGVSAAIRYEGINDPSQNPQPAGDLTQQYYFVPRFGSIGHRYVESGSFELDAPIFKELEVDASGRYDHYSVGFSHFSPKVGVKISPVRQFSLRGTFSRGFRVPSFAETAELPTSFAIGYRPDATSLYASQHLAPNGQPDAYTQVAALQQITAGNRDLKPETSTNFTAGFSAQPTRWLSLSADYYSIKKNNVIVAATTTDALAAYYNGLPLPSGFTVVQDVPDPAHPNAIPRLVSIEDSFVNAHSLSTSGIDIEAETRLPLGKRIVWSSKAEATYLLKFDEVTADGATLHFAGTLGPYAVTAASGSPRWRGNWQNTFEFGRLEATAVTYYTSGYRTTAEDITGPGTARNCANVPAGFYDDGVTPIRCHVRAFIVTNVNIAYRIDGGLTLYANVKNVTGAKAPFDPVTFGGYGYNGSWAEQGVIGRYFEIGARISL